VVFEAAADQLVVTIRDDGTGFDATAADRSGLGLAGMRERAVVLRSDLVIQTRRGRGTTVSIAVPLRTARSVVASSGQPVAVSR
jgi:signal transduction histidine kinase